MKTLHKILLALLITVGVSTIALCQDAEKSKALVKDGVALHDAGKYVDAIAKYDEALKLDPDNQTARYEKSFTLFSSGRGKEAIVDLETLIKLNPNYGAAFDMLGSIYDDDKQPEKAIEYYRQGIKVQPGYQRLHYNLGLAYLRTGKNKEAEDCAIDAIKLDPRHASSMRVYALATYNQNKRGNSLLAWCNFLLLEPQTQRSVSAFGSVKAILNYGIKKVGETSTNISVSANDLDGGNLSIQIAVLAAISDKKDLTPVDSLKLQLTSVFKILQEQNAKTKDLFYMHFLSDYFNKLAVSDNMNAFAHYISLTANKEEDVKWFKENGDKIKAFTSWLAATKREF